MDNICTEAGVNSFHLDFSLIIVLNGYSNIVLFEGFAENLEEVHYISLVDSSESAETEGIRCGYLTRIDSESALVAVIVDSLEAPVGVIGVYRGGHKSRSPLGLDDLTEAELVQSLVYGVEHACMACPLSLLALSPVLLESLNGRVYGLYRRSEVHLACALEEVVLEPKIAVVGALGVVLGLLDYSLVSDHEGKSRESHETLLSGRHAEVDVVLFDVDRTHSVGRGSIYREHRAVLVSKSAYLADRIEYARTCLVVGSVNEGDIGIFLQRLFNDCEVGALVNGEFEVDVGQSVELAHLNSSCAVRAVVHNEHLLALGQEGVDAHVDIDSTASAEEHRCILVEVAVNDLYEVLTESLHKSAELLLARAYHSSSTNDNERPHIGIGIYPFQPHPRFS